MANKVNSAVQECPLKNQPEQEKEPEKKFWIKVKIQNAENNEPIEGVVLDLKLPDENFTVLSSNNDGIIEIKNIEDGTCHLNIDWRELVQQGITSDRMVFIKL